MKDTNFQHLTWNEARDAFAHGLVAILPVGATEAHGLHLPLSTDVIIACEMSRRAAVRLVEKHNIETYILPPIAYAVTDFGKDFKGTISIKKETATALIRDVCTSVYEQGARLVVIANAHLEPEHIASIVEAIAHVERQTGRVVAFPDVRGRRWALTLTEEFRRGRCHAGCYETSLVLASRHELVRQDVRATLEPVPISISDKIREGAQTFHEAGADEAYFGDPRAATREEGEASYNALAEIIIKTVLEFLAE
ncbi:MAG: creatininase family protein [Pyrinomonadaceae bacterium]